MKKTHLLICFLLSCYWAEAQTYLKNVDEILEKHYTATGGKENWAKITSVKLKAKMNWGNGMEIPVEKTVIQDKAFRTQMSLQGKSSVRVVQKDKGWMKSSFGTNPKPQPLPPFAVQSMQGELNITGDLINYEQKGNAVEFMGLDDYEGVDVYKLKVTRNDGTVIYHHIDTESFLDLLTVQKIKTPEKEDYNYNSFSDFRKTNAGVILPFKQNGEEILEIEFNPTIDGKIFEMPAED